MEEQRNKEELSSEESNLDKSSNESTEPTKARKETLDEWLSSRVSKLEKLKSKTEQQKVLIALYYKEIKTPQDEKRFNVLVKAERAAERAENARKEAARILQAEKNSENKEKRKARNHELFKSAGLLSLAGLVDKETGMPTIDKAELLGALMSLANVSPDNPKRAEWKKAGAEKLKELESKK